MAINMYQPGVVQRPPERKLESELPQSDRRNDEALLDVLGVCAFSIGVREAANGNPDTGAKWALAGLAAVGGPRVLRAYFASK